LTEENRPSPALEAIATSPDLFTGLRGLARHLADTHAAQLLFVVTASADKPGSFTVHYDTLSPEAARLRNTILAATPLPLAAFHDDPACRHTRNGPDADWLAANTGSDFLSFLTGVAGDPVVLLPTRMRQSVMVSAVKLGQRPAAPPTNGPATIERACIARDYYQALATVLASHPLTVGGTKPQPPVTAQEAKVLDLCAVGLTDKEIAREMAISPHTVRAHLANAKRKLDARNKTHTVMRYKGLE